MFTSGCHSWLRNVTSGSARGVVRYQYTRFFPRKITKYLKITTLREEPLRLKNKHVNSCLWTDYLKSWKKKDTLCPNCDKKNTIYLYQKGSRYRIPKTPGRAWRIAKRILFLKQGPTKGISRAVLSCNKSICIRSRWVGACISTLFLSRRFHRPLVPWPIKRN